MAADGSLLEMQPELILEQDLMAPDIAYADNTFMITGGRHIDCFRV